MKLKLTAKPTGALLLIMQGEAPQTPAHSLHTKECNFMTGIFSEFCQKSSNYRPRDLSCAQPSHGKHDGSPSTGAAMMPKSCAVTLNVTQELDFTPSMSTQRIMFEGASSREEDFGGCTQQVINDCLMRGLIPSMQIPTIPMLRLSEAQLQAIALSRSSTLDWPPCRHSCTLT
eukprot:1147533-Pelagomonas_calceolata.AAC.1